MPAGQYIRTPEILEKNRLGNLGRKATPEQKANMSAGGKRRWADPEARAKQSVKLKETNGTLEFRDKMSVIMSEIQADPEYRQRQRESHLGEKSVWWGKHHTDETKAKMSKSKQGMYDGEKNGMWGREHTEVSKQKCRKTWLGLCENGYISPNRGRVWTEEEKQKQREKSIEVWQRPGYREHQVVVQTGKKRPRSESEKRRVADNKRAVNILQCILRKCIDHKNSRHTKEILGYSNKEFREYVESRFYASELYGDMTWDKNGWNVGKWQVHHIKSITQFLAEGVTDPKIINALSNLRPVWFEHHMEIHATKPDYKSMAA